MMAATAHGGPPPHHHQQQPHHQHQEPRMFHQPHQMMQQPPPNHQLQQQPPSGGAGGQQPGALPINFRVILNRDEVAFLFGFDGVLLTQLRQQTGANLMLTEPQGGHEQVLSIAGQLDLIFKAFSLICRKLWDFLQSLGGQQQLLIRLAVPASQCGSIIGKHGAKVKEIRDISGANIQVSQESLPDSTERCVELSGSGESCLQCAYHICCVLQDAPLRGECVPYVPKGPGGGMMPPQQRPDDGYKPVFLCGDKAYVIEGDFAVPAPPELLRRELAQTPLGDMAESQALLNNSSGNGSADGGSGNQSQPPTQQIPDYMKPLALMHAISNSLTKQGSAQPQTSREMSVSAGVVSALTAKNKFAEIRRISGAQVHVDEDAPPDAKGEKMLTLSGTEESVLLAQFLVQSNVDMAAKEREGGGQNGGPGGQFHQQQENGGHSMRQQNDPRLRDRGVGGGGFRGRRGGSRS
jgi:hypothetical protein